MPLLRKRLAERARWVERELGRLLRGGSPCALPFLRPAPKSLARAMKYSLLAGGKRLRPFLVLEAAECCGLSPRKALPTACALELIHTYSLIHDDLPAMDDDDLRRGKPTNHKVFGEALAILAGDGLLTLAFDLAAQNASRLGLGGADTAELIRVLAAGAGHRGMVGGQAADLQAEGWPEKGLLGRGRAKARRLLAYIHAHKTGALITASLEAGAVLAKASRRERRALRAYGRAVGLAFQIADDVLDRVGDKKRLGKRGSDEDNRKLTYPRLHGIEASRRLAERCAREARSSLAPLPRARALGELADFIVTRDR